MIEEAGYGEYFGHSLGIPWPGDSRKAGPFQPGGDGAAPGMIETVEPGIYIPDFGGVRIEDLVVLTEDGVRNLTRSPKNLIEL